MPAGGDDDGLLLLRQNRGTGLAWPSRQVLDRPALLPLGHGLRVDTVPFGQRSQALLTILYCSTDCLCRRGAAVKKLSHSASFHS